MQDLFYDNSFIFKGFHASRHVAAPVTLHVDRIFNRELQLNMY